MNINNIISKRIIQQRHRFSSSFSSSSSSSSSTHKLVNPSYQIYGEESAFTVKAIPPEYQALPSKYAKNDNSSNSPALAVKKSGRLLLEWTLRDMNTNKYQWNSSVKFALSPEEASSFFMIRLDPQLATLSRFVRGRESTNPLTVTGTSVVAATEIVRRPSTTTTTASSGGGGFYNNNNNNSSSSSSVSSSSIPEKVLRGQLLHDGSLHLVVDYERDGVGGQEPPDFANTGEAVSTTTSSSSSSSSTTKR
jgi:hypothetical protein